MVTLETLALVIALSGSGDTVLLEFTATACEPCRTMEPTVQRLIRDGFAVQRIDVAEHPEAASRFKVTGVPTFVMLADGEEVDRVVGACSFARLMQMHNKALPRRTAGDVRAQSPDRPKLQQSQGRARLAAAPPRELHPAPPRQERPGVDPRAVALQATVRIRVDDPQGQSIATGTIIDTHGSEALALTCGHLFRDSQGRGAIHVDLFNGRQSQTVQATLISYDLDRDIGLVSFAPGFSVARASIAQAGHPFRAEERVFSVGCDKGGEPSLRESRITSIDRYVGPPNIETAGAPEDGRSGGGLFSEDGYLIGVCNHADPTDDEGIYASLPTIHWELDRVGQRRIYQPSTATVAANDPANDPALRAGTQRRAEATSPPPTQPASPLRLSSNQQNVTVNNDTEVICIIRSRSNPQAGERIYYLNQPPTDLLDRLARESQRGLARNDNDHTGPREVAPRGLGAPASSGLPHPAGGPVVRAQSEDGR
jgi:hypothetical protein